ncbi:MAG: hypothetical protein AB1498_03555 [bacterium]
MKRFSVLAAICLMVIATTNGICGAEDVKDSLAGDVKIGFETSDSKAVTEENYMEEEMSQEEWEEKEQLAANKFLFETKCNKCHSFQVPLSKKKTFKDWKKTVEKMHRKDLAWILPIEVTTIIDYLYKINGIKENEIGQDTTIQQKILK